MKQLATFLSVLAMVAVAPLARADFQISVNGAAPCTTGSGNPATLGGEVGSCPVVVSGGALITLLSTSGTQTAANSQQFTSTLRIDNLAGAPITLTIASAVNDFTLPKTPPVITDSFGYTLNETTGAVTASTYTACVDQGNGLNAPVGVCGTAPSLTVTGANTTHTTPESTMLITSLSPSFGLNQYISLTLAVGTSVDVTASQTLTQVPEPAAILLFGTMLLGVTSIVRRKAAKRA